MTSHMRVRCSRLLSCWSVAPSGRNSKFWVEVDEKMGKLRAAAVALGLGLLTTTSFMAYGAAAAPAEQQDWPAYGGQDGTHSSSLSQINRDNVKNLVVAWEYDTGENGGNA